jgi:outer membrane lipoprotein-sorting protein
MGASRRPTNARAWFVGLLLTLVSGSAAAQEDVRALLERSLIQGDGVALSGEQVTAATGPAGVRREVVQSIRRRANRVRIDYLAPPGVRGQVMVDDGRSYRLFLPRFRLIEEGPSQVQRGAAQQQRLLVQLRRGRLDVRFDRDEAVAGRPARVLVVTPPHGKPRRLWIDRERAVVLKVEEQGSGGQVVSTYFTRVDFNAIPSDGDFVLTVPPGTQTFPARLGRPLPLARAQAMAMAWGGLYQAGWLPPGYSLRAILRTQIERAPAIVLLYGNGQQAILLFQGPARGAPNPEQVRTLNVAQREVEGVTLTAAGPVPPADLQHLLEAVAR